MKKELFIDGVPELLLLRLLAQNEMYGYELVAKIHSISEGAFRFGEGCIYPILHRLVGDRCLSIRKETVSGPGPASTSIARNPFPSPFAKDGPWSTR